MNNREAVVVDVRDPAEFRLGHGHRPQHPYSRRLWNNLRNCPHAPVVIVCNLGPGKAAPPCANSCEARPDRGLSWKAASQLKSPSLPLVKR